jgi:peptidoglycan/LPS O-acetylase OafA/YrhL
MKLQSIQALRGVAALLVVLFHLRTLEMKSIADNGLTEPTWMGGLFTNGYAGVDLFFVISGFIMVFVTRNSRSGPKPAADFLFARVTRIYPVWWAFVAAMTIYMTTAYGMSGQSPGWLKATNGQPILPYLAKSFLLIPQPAFPILNVGWTLVHEVYFYLVFTLFMLAPRRFLPVCLGGWAALVIAGATLGYSSHIATTSLSLALHPMTLEFILGAFAGLAVVKGWIWRSGVMTLLATLWLLTSLGYQGAETPFLLQWGRVFWYGLPAALLVYGAAGLDIQRRQVWLFPALVSALVMIALYQMTGLDGSAPSEARHDATLLSVIVGGISMLVVIWFGWLLGQGAPDVLRRLQPFFRRLLAASAKLGDWSFSLYLCHLIVLSVLRSIFGLLGRVEMLAPLFRLGHPGLLDNVTFTLVGLVVTITASWISYRMYEQPVSELFGHLRKKLFRRDQTEPVPA